MRRKCEEKLAQDKQFDRYYTQLGSASQTLLVELLQKIGEFIEATKESQKNEIISLDVKSYALRRQLAREVGLKYKGAVFTEFKKSTEQFTIKKWFKRNENKGANGNSNQKGQTNPE